MTFQDMLLVFVTLVVILIFSAFAFKFFELSGEFKKYERKFLHQKDELHKAAKINDQLRRNRDEWKELALKLDNAVKRSTASQITFTKDQLTALIQLCHPDKHGGKQSAVDWTAWLITERNNRK